MTKLLPLASLLLVLPAAQAVYAQTTLTVDQQSLTFTAAVGGGSTSLPLNVTSSSPTVILPPTALEQTDSQVAWLSVSGSGATPLALSVTVNPAGLAAGIYKGSIVINEQFGATVTVPVTLTVATIAVNPPSLTFQTSIGATPGASSVALSSAQVIDFTAAASTTTGGNWLTVSPTSGQISGFSAITAIPNPAIVPTLSAGAYQGVITITPTSGSSTTPALVPVTLTVTAAPAVVVSPASVNLQYQIGGANNVLSQTVNLTTTSSQGVNFTVTANSVSNPSGGAWVLPTPGAGTLTPAGTPLAIAYNSAANLPTGTWQSTVTVNTPTGSPTATNIPVTLLVSTQPLLNVPATPLSFTYELGSATPAAQSVTITTTSATAQNYSVQASTTLGGNWLTVPASGVTPTPIAISVNPAGLVPGNYTGTITINGVSTGNGPFQIPVTLKVADDPGIVTSVSSIAIPYQVGHPPASQTISVSSSNGMPLNFTATAATTNCGSNWLSLAGATGSTNGQVTVGINTAGLSTGVCTGKISIAATSTLNGAAAFNSPATIPVTLTVSAGGLLLVAPNGPALFTTQLGGITPAAQNFTIGSTDGSPLNFTVSAAAANGGGWLQVSEASGSTNSGNPLGITVQPGALTPGTYTGAVTITAAGSNVANSPLTIPVTLLVTAGSLMLSPPALNFQQAAGGPPPASQGVAVSSTGQPLGFTATAFTSGTVNWLSVSSSGATPGTLTVSVDGSKLAQGTYTGTVLVISTSPNAGNSPSSLLVTLVVNAGAISANATGLTFTQVQGGSPPAPQSLAVSGTPGPIPFQAAAATKTGGSWLTVSPGSATTQATLQIAIAANSLSPGNYAGSITITAAGASGSPLTIPVTLNVLLQDNLSVSPVIVTFTADPGSQKAQSAQIAVASAGPPAAYSTVLTGGSWLSASPSSGNTPASIAVTVNPAGLSVGSYSGTLTITCPNAISPVTVTINLVVGTVAPPIVGAIGNASSFGTGSVAPGENVVIFGTGIGPPQMTHGTVTNGVVDTVAGATRVLFDGAPAPVIYSLATQTSVMVPYEVTGRNVTSIVLEYQGVQSGPVPYAVTQAAPGIYTQNMQGSGAGAILNQDYSLNVPGAPAARGSVVAVYMTGEGYTPNAVDGAIATSLLRPVLAVTATVGGIPATVTYAGTAPGIVIGATQVNVQIPANAPSGPAVPIVITVGAGTAAVSTQAGVTIAIQ